MHYFHELNNNLFTVNGYKNIKARTEFFEKIVEIPAHQSISIEVDISGYNAQLILYSIAQVGGSLSMVYDVNNSNKNTLTFTVLNNSDTTYSGGMYPLVLTFFV